MAIILTDFGKFMFLKMAKYTTREHYLVSCLTRLDLTKEENMHKEITNLKENIQDI